MSHYEINVSLNGRHFFATADRSCRDENDVKKVLPEIMKRFPESDGFAVTVTYHEHIGYGKDVKKFLPKPEKKGAKK